MYDSALTYLLLLISIAIGWTLGYRFANQTKKSSVPDWIPSIEYLLSDQNSRSIEKLLSLDQIDDDAIDLFFKLGRSLRDKGEIDRATQLHQKLFARPDLDRSVVQSLQLELALDYSSAGLLDRAEKLYRDLLESKGHIHEKASKHLIELLEEEGEWQEIIDLYGSKKLSGSQQLSYRVAQASCELAQKALSKKEFYDTQNLTRQALKIDPQCARAHVVNGDLAKGQGEHNEAIRSYLKAAEIDEQSIIRSLESLVECFKAVDDQPGLQKHLKHHYYGTGYVPVLAACVESLAQAGQADEAASTLLQELIQRPSNQGFLSLAELIIVHKTQLDKSQLLAVYDILRRIVASEPKYLCSQCGFKAKEPHWRCPSCKSWSTIKAFAYQPPVNQLDV
ncbi:MAG: hypothetical protein P1U70_17625 [Saprospiraceae bacterium]|nr:hypothetical protein [Saprospiraceae bacterium]